jgi:hypothetical protein
MGMKCGLEDNPHKQKKSNAKQVLLFGLSEPE